MWLKGSVTKNLDLIGCGTEEEVSLIEITIQLVSACSKTIVICLSCTDSGFRDRGNNGENRAGGGDRRNYTQYNQSRGGGPPGMVQCIKQYRLHFETVNLLLK